EDERERGVDLDPLLDARQSVAARLERVLPGGPPTVEAILDDPGLVAGGDQVPLHHPRPAGLERQSAPRARADAPGERVGIDEEVLHPLPSASRGPTSAALRHRRAGNARVPPRTNRLSGKGLYAALKGPQMTAQGNALRLTSRHVRIIFALKGRHKLRF